MLNMRRPHPDHACSIHCEEPRITCICSYLLSQMDTYARRRMIMRTIMSALLGLSVLAGASASVSAADCKVAGWTDSVPGQHPIFVCPGDRDYR